MTHDDSRPRLATLDDDGWTLDDAEARFETSAGVLTPPSPSSHAPRGERKGTTSRTRLVALAVLGGLLIGTEPVAAGRFAGRATPHGAQIRVGMQGQRFTPAQLVATTADSIIFELQSGGPHNIAFDADSIPDGALEPLARALGSEPRFLVTGMLIDRGETFALSLAGLPRGTYHFHCTPHLGGGMQGVLEIR